VACENVVVGPAYASVRDLAPGEYVMTAVSDTGVGMTADVLERVFEPFFTTKGQGSGTGLGLATVDGIVRQFDGGISATSELGRGSTFRVFLPRDKSPVTIPAHAPVVAEPHPRGREHLLLIEDDESLRLLAVRVLERSGFTVSSYGDGASALGMSDADLARASMLVTDVSRPGITGREAADRLRERAPHLKVLFISGYTEDAVVQHGVLDGVVNFLAKPFSPDALARKVRAVLDA
jgi:CheY-like chemotaxis protein